MTGKYEKQLGGIAIRLESKATQYARKYAVTLLNNLVIKTPVDQGRARGNWVVSINSPYTMTVDSYPDGEGRSIDKATAKDMEIINKGLSVISKGYKNLGDSIYIQNNLPYINRLDKGWSKQAPYGFVKTAMRQTDIQFAYGKVE